MLAWDNGTYIETAGHHGENIIASAMQTAEAQKVPANNITKNFSIILNIIFYSKSQ